MKAQKSTYESMDAKQHEVDGDDNCALHVDYGSCDRIVVDEQV